MSAPFLILKHKKTLAAVIKTEVTPSHPTNRLKIPP